MLYLADELFFTGTAVEITPIRSVDRIQVGAGKRGPITQALQSAFFGLFEGRTPDKWGWLEPVDDEGSARRPPPAEPESMQPRTLFDKIWDQHVVCAETADTPAVLYIDLHLIHEVTSPQAFAVLRERGLRVRRPERTLGTLDHSTPTRHRADLRQRADRDRVGRARRSACSSSNCARIRRRAARPAQRSARHRPRHRTGARR